MAEIKCKVCSCVYCNCGNGTCKLEIIEVRSTSHACKDKETTMCDSFKER